MKKTFEQMQVAQSILGARLKSEEQLKAKNHK